jgi:transposase
MTIADHIREDTKLNFVRNLLKEGYDASFIAKMIQLSVKKVQEIIQKIKESNQ